MLSIPLLRHRRGMDPVDVLMLRQERDPRRRNTITVALRLREAPQWERLQARVEQATRGAPRLREKVVSPLVPLGLPVWVEDTRFDLGHHVMRTPMDPADDAAVLVHAEAFARDSLDLDRPLWQLLLLDPGPGGPATVLVKVSHALMDGLSGIEVLAAFVDLEPDPAGDRVETAAPPPQMTSFGLTAERLLTWPWQRQVRQVSGVLSVAATGGRALARPRATSRATWSYAGSLRRLVRMPVGDGSALLHARSDRRRLLSVEVPMAQLRAAGHAAGGSLGDAYLAGLIGGLRIYHEEMGQPVETVPFGMPISTRQPGDGLAANRFAAARFAAPVDVRDPAERIRQLHALVGAARMEPALDALSALAPALAKVPGLAVAVVGRELDRIDVQASNVPGPPVTTFLAGVEVERIFAFGPLPGPAVMCVLVSCAGVCCLGLTVDPAAVTDLPLFERSVVAGFDEVLALAGT